MTVLSTHNTVKRFIKLGFEEAQAEAIIEAITEHNNDLAPKSHVTMTEGRLEAKIDKLDAKIDGVESRLEAKIDNVESSLKNEINGLRYEINHVESKLEAKIDKLETVMKTNIGWLQVINIAILATVLSIALAPIAQNMFKAPVQENIPVISNTK